MVAVAAHVANGAVTHGDFDSARVIAVTRTRRQDRRIHRHRSSLPPAKAISTTDLQPRSGSRRVVLSNDRRRKTNDTLKPRTEQPTRKINALALVLTDRREQDRQPTVAEQRPQTLRVGRDRPPFGSQRDVDFQMELQPIGLLESERLLLVGTGASQLLRRRRQVERISMPLQRVKSPRKLREDRICGARRGQVDGEHSDLGMFPGEHARTQTCRQQLHAETHSPERQARADGVGNELLLGGQPRRRSSSYAPIGLPIAMIAACRRQSGSGSPASTSTRTKSTFHSRSSSSYAAGGSHAMCWRTSSGAGHNGQPT